MSKEEGFFDGLILGGIIGAAVGVLLSPSAGNELREKIKTGFGDLKEHADLPGIIEKIQAAIEEGKKAADETYQTLDIEGEQ